MHVRRWLRTQASNHHSVEWGESGMGRRRVIMVAASLTVAFMACSTVRSEPTDQKKVHGAVVGDMGTRVAGVQFDVVTQLLFPVADFPMGLNGSGVAVFARFWVMPGRIRMEIIWTEPMWSGNRIPWYAPATVVRSSDGEFAIQKMHEKLDTRLLPNDDRLAFDWSLGSYDLAESRYALSLARRDRVPMFDANLAPKSMPLSLGNRIHATAEVKCESGVVRSVRLLDQAGFLKRQVQYEYERNGATNRLVRQVIDIPESPLFTTQAKATVQINKQETKTVDQVPLIHHRQGRRVTVDWANFDTKAGMVRFPSEIRVNVPEIPWRFHRPQRLEQQRIDRTGRLMVRTVDAVTPYTKYSDLQGRPIRSCRIFNVKAITDSDWQTLVENPSELSKDRVIEERWIAIVRKHWHNASGDIPPSDRTNVETLVGEIRSRLDAIGDDDELPGERFRSLYRVMLLDLILHDDEDFIRHLKAYRAEFERLNLSEVRDKCLADLQDILHDWKRADLAKSNAAGWNATP